MWIASARKGGVERACAIGMLVCCGVMLSTREASALTVPPLFNPAPGTFGPEVGTSGYFNHDASLLNFELLDIGDVNPVAGSTFGFFFEGADLGNVASYHVIFDAADDSGGAPLSQQARVDFGVGVIIDLDAGLVERSFSGSGPIGFFYAHPLVTGGSPVFSVPSLNGGSDVMAEFPSLTSPSTYMFGFGVDVDGDGALDPVYYEVAIGLSPIPEPATVALLGLGAACLGLGARRRNRR